MKYFQYGLLLLTIGCLESAGDKPLLIPVSGTVSFDGSPLANGSMTFAPQATRGSSASALIQDDGAFEMGTFSKGDGVRPGEYKVSIRAFHPITPEEEAASPDGMVEPKLLTPEKYANPETSGLTASVKEDDGELTLEFTLEKE